MYKAKAYSTTGANSLLASTTMMRRDPTENDVQIEILFCGVCHSDVHSVRNEWSEFMPTYPILPELAIIARERTLALRDEVQARRQLHNEQALHEGDDDGKTQVRKKQS